MSFVVVVGVGDELYPVGVEVPLFSREEKIAVVGCVVLDPLAMLRGVIVGFFLEAGFVNGLTFGRRSDYLHS